MQVVRVVLPVSWRKPWTVLGGDDLPVEPIEWYLAVADSGRAVTEHRQGVCP
jgi:hypothetical protein